MLTSANHYWLTIPILHVCLTVIYRYPVEKKVSKYAIFFGCVWERADVLKDYFRNIVLGVKSLLYVNHTDLLAFLYCHFDRKLSEMKTSFFVFPMAHYKRFLRIFCKSQPPHGRERTPV